MLSPLPRSPRAWSLSTWQFIIWGRRVSCSLSSYLATLHPCLLRFSSAIIWYTAKLLFFSSFITSYTLLFHVILSSHWSLPACKKHKAVFVICLLIPHNTNAFKLYALCFSYIGVLQCSQLNELEVDVKLVLLFPLFILNHPLRITLSTFVFIFLIATLKWPSFARDWQYLLCFLIDLLPSALLSFPIHPLSCHQRTIFNVNCKFLSCGKNPQIMFKECSHFSFFFYWK